MNTQEISQLIPNSWHMTVSTENELIYLGDINIRALIQHWRRQTKDFITEIKKIENLIEILTNKTGKDFAILAKNYENPEFTQDMIGIRPYDADWDDNLEPLDMASKSRKFNATTYNLCGWCKFDCNGLGRHEYHKTTSCAFLIRSGMPENNIEIPHKVVSKYKSVKPLVTQGATEGERDAAKQAIRRMEAAYPGLTLLAENLPQWSLLTQRRFNTPCFLPYLKHDEINFFIKHLNEKKMIKIGQKQSIDAKIKFLLTLEKKTQKKPAFSLQRPTDYFCTKNEVVCFVADWENRLIPDPWATGRIDKVDGDRITVHFDKKIHSGPSLEGFGGNYGSARPELLHRWEYEYFRQHPDFTTLWIQTATSNNFKYFSPEKMLDALTQKALSAPTDK